MKKLYWIGLSLLSLSFILSSCSVEKRVHRSGYHLDWNSSAKGPKVAEKEKEKASKEAIVLVQSDVKSTKPSELSYPSAQPFLAVGEVASQSATPALLSRNSTHSSAATPQVGSNPAFIPVGAKTISPHFISESAESPELFDPSEGKSQLVALLLVVLVGVLGIHRFYLGYTTIGIVMLLTGGVCGILALIDLIRIITGDLKPINGDYTEKL